MNTIESMIQNVSGRYFHKIQKICKPLVDHFGINHFSYVKIKNDGNLLFLGTHMPWMEYYCNEKFYLQQPHFRHPRNFKSGISLSKHIHNEEYSQLRQLASQQFNVNFGVCVLNQTRDGLEIIGLDTNTPCKLQDVKIVNELDLIRVFVNKCIKGDSLLVDLLEQNQVNLQLLLGEKFQTNNVPIMPDLFFKERFLREIGMEIPKLSSQEKKVLKELLHGRSAREIAENLFLSPRTIEHHLERLKNKLNCFSKSELISKAKELDVFGYFEI